MVREIVLQLLKQGKKELKYAEDNFKLKNYSLVAFLCQQSVEKLLKAVYIHEKKEDPPKTHNLRPLVIALENIPKEIISFCLRLNPHYIIARYPDAANGVPYEMYDKEIAGELLEYAQKVFEYFLKRDKFGS
jgi:hypothetical protein